MLTAREKEHLFHHACVPEQITSYVEAVTGAEPFLAGEYLCYMRAETLIFVGYPLGAPFSLSRMEKALNEAVRKRGARDVSLLGPEMPASLKDRTDPGRDAYYLLDLSSFSMPGKVRNMVKRASGELDLSEGPWTREHDRMLARFFETRPLDPLSRSVMEKIPAYLSSGASALLLSARDRKGRLTAFDVADFGAGGFAFYMFNVTARDSGIPGASDLLLARIVKAAQEKGRRFINLGLGINPGVTFFKKKWGGRPFLTHLTCTYGVTGPSLITDLLGRL